MNQIVIKLMLIFLLESMAVDSTVYTIRQKKSTVVKWKIAISKIELADI